MNANSQRLGMVVEQVGEHHHTVVVVVIDDVVVSVANFIVVVVVVIDDVVVSVVNFIVVVVFDVVVSVVNFIVVDDNVVAVVNFIVVVVQKNFERFFIKPKIIISIIKSFYQNKVFDSSQVIFLFGKTLLLICKKTRRHVLTVK
jgi:hypothetical protein